MAVAAACRPLRAAWSSPCRSSYRDACRSPRPCLWPRAGGPSLPVAPAASRPAQAPALDSCGAARRLLSLRTLRASSPAAAGCGFGARIRVRVRLGDRVRGTGRSRPVHGRRSIVARHRPIIRARRGRRRRTPFTFGSRCGRRTRSLRWLRRRRRTHIHVRLWTLYGTRALGRAAPRAPDDVHVRLRLGRGTRIRVRLCRRHCAHVWPFGGTRRCGRAVRPRRWLRLVRVAASAH